MTSARFRSFGVRLVVAIGLGAGAMSFPGCEPPSEGRPAGSIEVKNNRSTPGDIEAAKAKVSPRR